MNELAVKTGIRGALYIMTESGLKDCEQTS